MGDFVSFTCPSCGGKFQVSSDIDRFACAHCGNKHIIKRGDGIISLQPIVEGLPKVQSGVDKTTSELAIKRLAEEIVALKAKRKEVIGNWHAEYFAYRGLIVFMFASFTFCNLTTSWSSTNLYGKLLMVFSPLITLVIMIIVFRSFLIDKAVEEKKWKEFDVLISSKRKSCEIIKNLSPNRNLTNAAQQSMHLTLGTARRACAHPKQFYTP